MANGNSMAILAALKKLPGFCRPTSECAELLQYGECETYTGAPAWEHINITLLWERFPIRLTSHDVPASCNAAKQQRQKSLTNAAGKETALILWPERLCDEQRFIQLQTKPSGLFFGVFWSSYFGEKNAKKYQSCILS